LDGGCCYKDYHGLGNLVAMDLDKLEIYWKANID